MQVVQPTVQPQLVQTATGQIVAVQPAAQPVVSAQPIVVSPQMAVQPNAQPTVVQAVPAVQPAQAVVVQQWVSKPVEHVNCPPGLGSKLKLVQSIRLNFHKSIYSILIDFSSSSSLIILKRYSTLKLQMSTKFLIHLVNKFTLLTKKNVHTVHVNTVVINANLKFHLEIFSITKSPGSIDRTNVTAVVSIY